MQKCKLCQALFSSVQNAYKGRPTCDKRRSMCRVCVILDKVYKRDASTQTNI